MLTWLALVPLAILFVGFTLRRQRTAHMAVMALAIVVDLAVVGVVEANRHVIAKAAGPRSTLLTVHICLAASSLLGYVAAVVSGVLLWKGRGARRVHKALGVLILVVRTFTSATSFFVVGR